jgi:hypothetical protein
MIEQMHEVQAKLDLLVGALDGHDAGAIVSATEDLATAVILFRGAGADRQDAGPARSGRDPHQCSEELDASED